MECPDCRHINGTGAKFCTSCGSPLPVLCPACRTVSPAASRFCSNCGGRLAEPAAATAQIPAPAALPSHVAAPSAERRHLTVMFCDLVGSTGLSARLDPEDMRDLIARYRTCVAEAVSRFDGFIAQHLGDGVLVYFGYPQAHEDDPERAIKAGLAAIIAVDGLKVSATAPLKARVGIASGLVVVGEQIGSGDSHERVAIGETPNLAARLQGMAAPGEVVISVSTRRLVGGMFDLRALGSIEVKGLPHTVEAWQVGGEAAGVSRFEARHAGTLSPLVGRQEEIELLLRRWHQAKAGEGRVVLLSGEPGIGKSRIAESLLDLLSGEPHVRLRYFCSPHHAHSALHPFIAQLERAADFQEGNSAGAKLDKLEALLGSAARNVPQDVALIAELLAVPTAGRYPVLTVGPQLKREMTLAALLDQLAGVAAIKPALVVFEDAHWIDPTSLDLLDRTVARVASLPVLMVVTFRPDLQPTWVGQPHVTMLPLSRLGRREGAGIISGVTKGKPLPDAVVEQILARTDGVPLFIEELTTTMLESGLLHETKDRYVLDGPLPPLAIPVSLQASLVARLDRLASVKDVAQIGAAIGREFSHKLIAEVAVMAPMDLDTELERLTASGLVSRRGVPPEAIYAFKHALVQDAAYATLLKSRRQQLHVSIANALVEHFAAMAEGLPEVVAHHFSEAGLASEAIGYWCKAGQLASARSANREAVKFFERAMDILNSLPESLSVLKQAFEVRLELRPVLVRLGEARRALAILREAEALAERLDDDHRRGRVQAYISTSHTLLGELDEALVAGTSALALADRLGDLRLRILSVTNLVQAYHFRGEYLQVVKLANDNLASLPADLVYESFGRGIPPSASDRRFLVMSLAQLGRFNDAASCAAELEQLVGRMPHAQIAGQVHNATSTLLLLQGEWARACSVLDDAIAVVRAGDIVLLRPSFVASSAWALAMLGDYGKALERVTESEQLVLRLEESGLVHFLAGNYNALGRACLTLGRLDEAKRLADRASNASLHQPGFMAHARNLLGDIASHPNRFDADASETQYRQALALAEPRGMRPLVGQCHLGLGKLCRRLARPEEAREHLTIATMLYREMDMSFWLEQAETELRQPT